MSSINDQVKEAQKRLKKQRKQKEKLKAAAVPQSATRSTALESQDTTDASDDDALKAPKRKRGTDKDLKAGESQKRQKTDASSSSASASEAQLASSLDAYGPVYPLTSPHQVSKVTKKSKRRKRQAWVLSQPVAGRLLPIEPIFSHDEKFLLLATRNAILVYSTTDSLLYRKISVESHGPIRCVALSPATPSQIYAGTSTGHLLSVNWLLGVITSVERVASSIDVLVACHPEEEQNDTLYYVDATITENGKQGSRLCRRASGPTKSEAKVLLDVSKPLRCLKVLAHGRVIIAASEHNLFLGLISDASTSLGAAHSTWHQVQSTEPVVSICAKSRLSKTSPSKAAGRASNKVPSIDLAVGTLRGQIHVYEDFVTQLTGSSVGKNGMNSTARPTPRVLHWHRGPVSTVQWSVDGNYLISGGSETVLQLWQMKTGKRQDLPHLTSAIDCVTVSPSGTSYGVQLADNSVMVLSTAELQPTAHISGIQAQAAVPEYARAPQLRHAGPDKGTVAYQSTTSGEVAAVVHPKHNNQLLLAVPASSPKVGHTSLFLSAPFLQTYDLSVAHSKSRQALTRNNATNFTTGPDMTPITEPNVKRLQISNDGQWLASVEEWLPPQSDLDFTGLDRSDIPEQQALRLEVYLKFWRWDSQQSLWILDTRIDSPHQFPDGTTPARITCLCVDPTNAEFTTTGEDGVLEIWAAKTRFRDAVVVRGQGGTTLTVWSCRATVKLNGPVINIEEEFAADSHAAITRAAYAEDGSVIAACSEDVYGPTNGMVRLIDTATGAIKQSRPDLFTSGLKHVDFIDRYLIVLSDSLLVYDLVDDEVSYQHDFNTDGAQLAVNSVSGTFAIALPTSKSTTCRVVVFDPKSPVPLYDSPRLDTVTALLSVPSSAGYLLLNNHAEVRTLSSNASLSMPLLANGVAHAQAGLDATEAIATPQSPPKDDRSAAELDDEMEDVDPELEAEGEDDEEDEDEVGTSGVVRPQQLAALFEDRPSFAMPPVRDMFDAIVKLYGKKAKSSGRNKARV